MTYEEKLDKLQLDMLKLKKRLLITEQQMLAEQIVANKSALVEVVHQIKQAVQKPLPSLN